MIFSADGCLLQADRVFLIKIIYGQTPVSAQLDLFSYILLLKVLQAGEMYVQRD
jgi:hypothetical protein